MTNTFLAIAKGLFEGIGSAAMELNKHEAQRQALEERRNKEQHINITVDTHTPREPVYVVTRRTEVTQVTTPKEKEITYTYSLETLEGMTDENLRDEVYAISREKSGSNYTTRKAAKDLYHDHSYLGSQIRYRARMIKFLYENGQI